MNHHKILRTLIEQGPSTEPQIIANDRFNDETPADADKRTKFVLEKITGQGLVTKDGVAKTFNWLVDKFTITQAGRDWLKTH